MKVERTLPLAKNASFAPEAQVCHHVPGRLRVKLASIQWNEGRAFAVERALRRLEGVLNANANPLTGSVVVHFAPQIIGATSILESLAEMGFGSAKPTQPRVARAREGARESARENALATRVAGAVAARAFETLAERCSLALIAALI
jgi:hypothetical protein